MLSHFVRAASLAAALFLPAATLSAGEKKLMHCFAFTVIESATQADWDAFGKATDAIPSKIPGVTRVWRGKLRAPLTVYQVLDADARKKLNAGAEKVSSEVSRRVRQHGVCMEMNDEAALKTYADHPYHKDWMAAYEKVRVAGTTTYDIIGQ